MKKKIFSFMLLLVFGVAPFFANSISNEPEKGNSLCITHTETHWHLDCTGSGTLCTLGHYQGLLKDLKKELK